MTDKNELATLKADNERLREALETIRDSDTTVTERCEKSDELVTMPLDMLWARFIAERALKNDNPPSSVRRAALEKSND